MEAASEELQVVGAEDEGAKSGKDSDPRAPGDGRVDADRNGSGNREDGEQGERPGPELGAERPAMELVQRMRSDSNCEEERRERR